MRTSTKFLIWIIAYLLFVVALGFYADSRTSFNPTVSIAEGVDRAEANRIFAIAKPAIDQKLSGDASEMTYRVSRFDGQWVVTTCHKDLQFVPGGDIIFLVDCDGKLLEM